MRRLSLFWRAFALLAISWWAASGPAAAESDPRAKQAEIRSKKAAAAAKVDGLTASEARVAAALDALDAEAQRLTARLVAAQARATALERESAAAGRSARSAEEVLAAARRATADAAVAAYASPSTAVRVVGADDPSTVARAGAYLAASRGVRADALDTVRAARVDAERARRAADAAARRASQQKAAVASELGETEIVRAAQSRVADQLEGRLAAARTDQDALAAADAELGALIARQDLEAAARRRAELLAGQAADEAERTRLQPPRAPSPPGGAVTVGPATGGLVTVRGITVDASLGNALAALLSASDGAGLRLGGGGYRSPQQQIQTRRNNCGTSNYDVYEKPASSCSPPTAKPGSSMHERGLAIDFTNNGSLISSRSNPGYRWLASNAGRFGFRNLPSEPWHWSTNGN